MCTCVPKVFFLENKMKSGKTCISFKFIQPEFQMVAKKRKRERERKEKMANNILRGMTQGHHRKLPMNSLPAFVH